jgi:hypothetical protein
MTINSIAAALVLAFSCVLSVSCLQAIPDDTAPPSSTSTAPPASEPIGQVSEPMGPFRNPWVFTVTKNYDGQDGAGGEQEATAPIGFVAATVPPHYFVCNVRVRMPVQTLKHGRITKRYAAAVTLKVSDEAADLMDWREWGEPTTVYCRQYVEKMQNVFRERYAGIGARVTQ